MMKFPRTLVSLAFVFTTCACVRAAAEDEASRPQLVSRTGGNGGGWSTPVELQKAAEAGNAEAEFQLGELLLSGGPLPKDIPKGLAMLEKAAQAKVPKAAFRLGKAYDDGDIVPKDYAKALTYYKQAAYAGHAEAQYNIGVLYSTGRGVARDFAEGLAWLIVAGKNGADGDGEARVRERMKGYPKIIARGEQRAVDLEKEIAAQTTASVQSGASPASSGSPSTNSSVPSAAARANAVNPPPASDRKDK
jgi:hypothetical protein